MERPEGYRVYQHKRMKGMFLVFMERGDHQVWLAITPKGEREKWDLVVPF